MEGTRAWSAIEGGVRIAVRVTPRGGRDGLEGVVAETGVNGATRPHLGLRIAAVPVDGAANDAVERLLARLLGAKPADVEVVAGEAARLKLVEVDGDPVQLIRKLQTLTTAAA